MSLISDLFNTLDKRSLSGISEALGESETAASRGMQGSMAAVMGGMATKSNNPSFLRRMLDMAPAGSSDISRLMSGLADPNSPVTSGGKQILSSLFGNSEGMLTRALSSGLGMRPGPTGSMLAMAAPLVLGFLGRRVRDERMSMEGLGNLLERETPSIRAALPEGVTELLWPRERETVASSPVVAQTVARERSSGAWILPLVLLALIPAIYWLFNHWHRPTIHTPTVATGTANRLAPDFVQTPKPAVQQNIILHFATGSSKLDRQSSARLNEFVKALGPNSNADVTVSGYTDNVGNADSNMRLSQARADEVKADLIREGLDSNHVSTQAYGQESPMADNSTADGRGNNRRVIVAISKAR